MTLPGRPVQLGRLHPTTRVLRDILGVFNSLGFRTVEGPEVELDYYNFELLNIPADHPARDMWDTFYVDDPSAGQVLLRTHTSPNQIRVMEQTQPPIRVVVPGKCYRYEAIDATHEIDVPPGRGLAVDEGITMADLKGTLTRSRRRCSAPSRKVMFCCSYFPFVEPGVEVAIDCFACKGAGCRALQAAPAGSRSWAPGMVHPRVLEMVGYDPSVYTGFAFGMGPERIAMLKYGIDDIRQFYGNDLRFLRQVKYAHARLAELAARVRAGRAARSTSWPSG